MHDVDVADQFILLQKMILLVVLLYDIERNGKRIIPFTHLQLKTKSCPTLLQNWQGQGDEDEEKMKRIWNCLAWKKCDIIFIHGVEIIVDVLSYKMQLFLSTI